MTRQTTGVPGLDEHLGGGLLPGALTVVVGAAGVGKTQFGVQYAAAGLGDGAERETQRGLFFDMSSRGDSQYHADYAQRIADWRLREVNADAIGKNAGEFFSRLDELGDYLHVFDYSGRRVTRQSLDEEAWRQWQGEINVKLAGAIGFLYGNFVRGARRLVIDGVEPVADPRDSIQFTLFEYVYHQVVRKEHDWVARDFFRERYRASAEQIAAHAYDRRQIGCLLLCTSRETMLADLVERGLDEGDSLANANTVIYMGRIRDGEKIARGLVVAKHRGSACSDEVVRYRIGEKGLKVANP
jgi:KaiC/GvpD/RAD55 family RecA-like ATPase